MEVSHCHATDLDMSSCCPLCQPQENPGKSKDSDAKLEGIVLRNYQVMLTELGKNNNIIACLPTGSGKTQIAVQLALHYARNRNGKKNLNDKIVFLVPTVPLANQQAKVFQQELSTKVFTSETNRGAGNKASFDKDVAGHEVLIMTAQLFLNLMEEELITFEEIMLLVLDECHHAVKEHPMNNIMKLYKKQVLQGFVNLPRILGLTATVVKKNVHTSGIAEEIEKIEIGMCSKAVTYEDYQEVLEHSTKAKVTTKLFSPEERGSVDRDTFLHRINNALKFLELLPYNVKYEDLLGRRSDSADFLGSEITKDLLKILEEVVSIYEDFGPLGAVHAARHKLNYVEDELPKTRLTPFVRRVYSLVGTALEFFMATSLHTFRDNSQSSIEDWSSSKVNLLFDILKSYRDKEDTDDRICCLVFVNKRSSTYSLQSLLKQWIESNQEEYGFLVPSIVVGVNNTSQTSVRDRITKYKQTKILQKFREKKINVLITTSILEEGIDVPSCNLVIRMDPLQSYTSMIQSMGRARSPNAKYIVLMARGSVTAETKKIENFQAVRRDLTETLVDQMREVMANLTVSETPNNRNLIGNCRLETEV